MPIDTTDLLRELGPGLTTRHIAELVATGISETAARKRVQRASEEYQRLAGIRFEKNARLIYRPEDYGDILFWIISQRILAPIVVVVPIYMMFQSVRMLDTHLAIILTYAVITLPLDVWTERLSELPDATGLAPAVVYKVDESGAEFVLATGQRYSLPWENGLDGIRPYLSENRRGGAYRSPQEFLKVGDLIRVARDEEDGWRLTQVPDAQAALVSLNPGNGAILSLVGGSDYEVSKFNRATQAQRQPGSNMKPFLYAAALDAGRTAATIINDAPLIIEDRSLEGVWRPENDSGEFYGPTRLRWALTKSRNLVSIRLLQDIGIATFIDYATRLGFDTSDFAADLSLALGTHAMAPLEVAGAYAILANGGYRVEPYLIQRIDNLVGETVFEANPALAGGEPMPGDDLEIIETPGSELSMEEILTRDEQPLQYAERVMDERVSFIIDSILKDVIRRGTGRKALVLDRDDIAGKTGTTNSPMDAWFSGYNGSVVTTTWVGFDGYTPLGRREFGGTAALPIWIDFMREALAGTPSTSRSQPPGISYLRIDPETGLLADSEQRNAIFEYFRTEFLPESTEEIAGKSPGGSDTLIQDIF